MPEAERVQYRTQLDAIQRVLAVYDANENDEQTAAEAEELMRQMDSIGKPGADAPCSIM